MSLDLALALIGFAFVTSITPGPNNMMILASGANFGFRRSLPHLFGIALGHGFLIFILGLGAGQVFDKLQGSEIVLAVLATAYMLWLAWKIAHAAEMSKETAARARPLTFVQAAAFQWVNPKGIAMAVTAVTLYAPSQGWGAMLAVALIFCAVNLPSVTIWGLMGQSLKRWLTTRRRLVVFNRTMAVLLVLSLWPVLRGFV